MKEFILKKAKEYIREMPQNEALPFIKFCEDEKSESEDRDACLAMMNSINLLQKSLRK